ncbi:hypothetical protein MBANPS3_012321 [Mucor bainieri]
MAQKDAIEYALSYARSQGDCLSKRNTTKCNTYNRLACVLRNDTPSKKPTQDQKESEQDQKKSERDQKKLEQHQKEGSEKKSRKTRVQSCDCKYAINIRPEDERWLIKQSKHGHNHDPLPQNEMTAYALT